jgi:hypothetical protein
MDVTEETQDSSTDTTAEAPDATEQQTAEVDTGGEHVEQQEQPQAPAPEVKKPDPMSPRFALLAKKEKALVDRDRELTEKEQKLKDAEKELGRWRQIEEAKKKKDWDAIVGALGSNEEDLKETMTGISSVLLRKKDLPPEVIEVLRWKKQQEDAAAEAAKKAEEDAKKAEEQTKTQATEQARAQRDHFLLTEALPHIAANAATLEVIAYLAKSEDTAARDRVLLKIWDKLDADFEGAKAAAKAKGEALGAYDVKKALAKIAEEVESEFATSVSGTIQPLLGLKKLQPKKDQPTQPQTPRESRAAALAQLNEGQPANPRPKSLTNSVQQAPVREDTESVDPDVLFQRALKLL